jgi:mono/diheme cytochrome c family protein
VACHGANGKGEAQMFPPLAGNPVLLQSSSENLIRVVLAGAQAVSTPAAPTGPSMPSFAWKLNDAQLADLLTYDRNNWGNQAPPVSPDIVTKIRATLKSGS